MIDRDADPTLRNDREETTANSIKPDGTLEIVPSTRLKISLPLRRRS
jgi:hypothetical protein